MFVGKWSLKIYKTYKKYLVNYDVFVCFFMKTIPIFMMSDGEETLLAEFTLACELSTMLSSGYQDSYMDIEFDENCLDESSLEGLIMSTGFMLE